MLSIFFLRKKRRYICVLLSFLELLLIIEKSKESKTFQNKIIFKVSYKSSFKLQSQEQHRFTTLSCIKNQGSEDREALASSWPWNLCSTRHISVGDIVNLYFWEKWNYYPALYLVSPNHKFIYKKKNPFDSECNCSWVYSQRVKAFRATKTISESLMEAKQIAQHSI